ncbi:MAG: peptidase M64 [Bacteroidaceae bacterium]|nr:peptidase M64 [Bacteroidaceae bacterium]
MKIVHKHTITALLLSLQFVYGIAQNSGIDTSLPQSIEENFNYQEYFTENTMRYDFHHAGNSNSEYYLFDRLKREGLWAGSKKALINPFDYGEQHFRIIDAESGKTIYKNNYCTLFNEWQTTAEATEVSRSMPEGIIFPEPKRDFYIEIYARNKVTKVMEKKHSHRVKVNDYNIRPYNAEHETMEIHIGGSIEHSLDIVLLPEGFTCDEKDKFEEACRKWADALFSYEPFRQNMFRINIRAVWATSKESGISEPGHGVWKDTNLGARFFTFGSERYQMIEDFQAVRDVAASAPYESIFILTNTTKYGGGGIYNFYGLGSAGNIRTGEVYVHEFGHSLMGLGDEYVEVGNTVSSFYPAGKEPWEANLTTFVNFDKKWKNMIADDTAIPTPFDSIMLSTPQEELIIGAYEGGGYLEKGIYRPTPQCMMNQLRNFCPVCQKAIVEYLDYICK